jgi:hypothetical protein
LKNRLCDIEAGMGASQRGSAGNRDGGAAATRGSQSSGNRDSGAAATRGSEGGAAATREWSRQFRLTG